MSKPCRHEKLLRTDIFGRRAVWVCAACGKVIEIPLENLR